MKKVNFFILVVNILAGFVVLYGGCKRSSHEFVRSRPFKRARQPSEQEQESLNIQLRKTVSDLSVESNKDRAVELTNQARALLFFGADLNAALPVGPSGEKNGTMLHKAVLDLDIEQVHALIDLGADVNAYADVGVWQEEKCEPCASSPLQVLTLVPYHDYDALGHAQKIAHQLIAAGADVNLCGPDNASIFHLTRVMNCCNMLPLDDRYLSIMISIFGSEDNINRASINGLTPVLTAASLENFLYARKLIDAGADVNQVDNHGNNLLHYVASSYTGGLEDNELNIDFKGAWVDLKNAKNLVNRALEQCSTLLDQQNIKGETPLFVALARGGAALNIYKFFLQLSSHEDVWRRSRATTILGEHCIHLLTQARKPWAHRSDRRGLCEGLKKEFEQNPLLTPQCRLAKLLKWSKSHWCTWRKQEAARCRKEVKSWFIGKLGQAEPEHRYFLPAVIVEIILKTVGQFEPELY